MGRCPTPRKGEAGLRSGRRKADVHRTSCDLDLPKNSLRSFFCTRPPAFGGHIFRLRYQYAEKPHESYIIRLNLCVKAANYYKQTLAMEDYNNGI